MDAQPNTDPSSTFIPALSHLHFVGTRCPTCNKEIRSDEVEEIRGRIARQDTDRMREIAVQFQQHYELKAKGELENERQRSAEREAAARASGQQEIRVLLAAAEANRLEAEQAGASLKAQLTALQVAAADQEAQIRADAQQATAQQLAAAEAAWQSQVTAKDELMATALAEKAAAEQKLAALAQQEKETLKQALDEQREAMEKAGEAVLAAEKLASFESNQKLQKQLDDMKRTVDKKTADELGTGAELNLLELLSEAFTGDVIEHIGGKGRKGADVLHTVMFKGEPCGKIIVESKNTQRFQQDYITKLKQDQAAADADYAILSLHTFPPGAAHLDFRDGVILASPARVVAVAAMTRNFLLRHHKDHVANTRRDEKAIELYAYITSDSCTAVCGHIESLIDQTLKHMEKEKRWHDLNMKQRGERYRTLQKAAADLISQIGLITGTGENELELFEFHE